MEINIINFYLPELTGLAKTIGWFITLSSSIAVGVILFTLILKLITFPFDLYSRISTRKNSLKMEKMRPELEKLQTQYANDKAMYSQKMMSLYKQNGYSMWGACLPSIVTLVIFIVAISAFSNFSAYQNKKYFKDMSIAYNQVIFQEFSQASNEYITIDGESFTVNNQKIVENLGEVNQEVAVSDQPNLLVTKLETANSFSIRVLDKAIRCEITYGADYATLSRHFYVIEENLGEDYQAKKQENPELTALDYFKDKCREASAQSFRTNKSGFLWVKNIFIPDSPLKKTVYSEWKDFVNEYQYKENNSGAITLPMTAESYKELIYNLQEEQSQANGYFILVGLTILTSLAQQLIVSKSQKAQAELQTVDGKGAEQQKFMNILMPVMMGVFAFMYTAAFSIYIILSSVIGVITTLGINFFVDRKFKMEEKAENSKKIRGRVYQPTTKEVKEPEKKAKKQPKIEEHDFLSGLADKKKKKK